MPSSSDIILGVAALLFLIAAIALVIWAFKSFMGGKGSPGFLRARDRRLALVETASIDSRRKLMLVRRDDIEHLILTGGPVDILVETGIQARRPLEPPLEDVIIARSDTRPAPDYSKG